MKSATAGNRANKIGFLQGAAGAPALYRPSTQREANSFAPERRSDGVSELSRLHGGEQTKSATTKSGRHKAPRDYGASLNLSGKGLAMKGKRRNARRV